VEGGSLTRRHGDAEKILILTAETKNSGVGKGAAAVLSLRFEIAEKNRAKPQAKWRAVFGAEKILEIAEKSSGVGSSRRSRKH